MHLVSLYSILLNVLDLQYHHPYTNLNPSGVKNPIRTCNEWWSTLLCAPHVPMAVPPWRRPSRPYTCNNWKLCTDF